MIRLCIVGINSVITAAVPSNDINFSNIGAFIKMTLYLNISSIEEHLIHQYTVNGIFRAREMAEMYTKFIQ